jgi:hypothetical protein
MFRLAVQQHLRGNTRSNAAVLTHNGSERNTANQTTEEASTVLRTRYRSS